MFARGFGLRVPRGLAPDDVGDDAVEGGGVLVFESFRAAVQGPDLRCIGRSCFSSQKSKTTMLGAELLHCRAP